MKALFIATVWAEPTSSAAGLRSLQLITLFREWGWTVGFASTAPESSHAFDLGTLGVSMHSILLNDPSFDSFCSGFNPDLVVFDRFTAEEQFGWRVTETVPKAVQILDMQDVHSLRKSREDSVVKGRQQTGVGLNNDMALRELAAIYRCDLSLVISEVEYQHLQQVFGLPSSILHYCPFFFSNMTEEDVEKFPSFEARTDFVFIGNFLHQPNWDATRYLKTQIWPLIRKRLPETQLHIYGGYSSQKVLQLHNEKEGFLVHGRALSAHQVVEEARVLLAPLRFGAGLKGKCLEAMRAGTPIITTPIGAEGLQGDLAWSGKVVSGAEKTAQAAISYYENKDLWQKAQQHGMTIYNQRFSKDLHIPPLKARLLQLLTDIDAHRAIHFTGQLLRHHTLKSTKYMSKWIQEKNKPEKG